MALTNLQKMRLRIGDPYRNFSESFAGDGQSVDYDLAHFPVKVSGYTAYIDGVLQAETANYALSTDDGRLAFTVAPPSGSVVRLVGRYATFSDTELADMMSPIATGATAATYDSLDSATLTAIEVLLGNAWRLHNWSAAGGQSVSEGQVFKNLKEMRDLLRQKLTIEQGPQGQYAEWAEEQESYNDGDYD